MTAVPDGHFVGDADMVGAALTGDRTAFACIYDRYADRLHDFCVGMLRDRDAAADCVQDVFCTAAISLGSLREPDRLRSWLYAIARNEALRRIRQRRREEPSDELPEVASGDAGPDTLAARNELATLIAEAAGGLSDRDRSVLELGYRHGLEGSELARALGVAPANANKMLQRLRDTMERSLGALLIARRARSGGSDCAELVAVLADWDDSFTILMRKRIARHIETCATCDRDRRRMVNPAALLGGAPLLIPAPGWLRDHTLSRIRLTSAGSDVGSRVDDEPTVAQAVRRPAGRVMLTMSLLIGIPLIALAIAFAWRSGTDEPVSPDAATTTATTQVVVTVTRLQAPQQHPSTVTSVSAVPTTPAPTPRPVVPRPTRQPTVQAPPPQPPTPPQAPPSPPHPLPPPRHHRPPVSTDPGGSGHMPPAPNPEPVPPRVPPRPLPPPAGTPAPVTTTQPPVIY